MKRNVKLKQAIFEIILIILTITLLIFSILSNFKIITLPKELILTFTNEEDLFVNLFTIQATIATLSIAIIALITGFYSENIYGISITNYITSIKPYLFKHKYLILFDLILIALNYVFVSKQYYNISIFAFILSITISFILVKDVSVIFYGKTKIRNEIHEYIIQNYNNDYLEELNKNTITDLESGNINSFYSDLDLLIEIFDTEAENKKVPTDILITLEDMISNLFVNYYIQNNSETNIRILSCIYSFYKSANKDEKNIIPLTVWDNTYREYFQVLEELNYGQINNHPKFNFEYYRLELDKNRKFEYNDKNELIQKNAYNLEYYSYWIYNSLLNNKRNLSEEQINHLKERIYRDIYDNLRFRFDNENYKNEKYLLLKEFCYLIKLFIENGNSEFLFKEYYSKARYHKSKSGLNISILISLIYIFYLTQREYLTNGKKEEKNAYKILKKCKRLFKDLIYSIDIKCIIENHYDFLHGLLRSWEIYENGVVKTVVMDSAIIDFFVFFSLEKYIWENKIYEIIKLIPDKDSFWLYSRYFCNDTKNFEDDFSTFLKVMFGITNEKHINSKIDLVKNALIKLCKEESIMQGIDNAITFESLKIFSSKLNKLANQISNEVLKEFSKSKNIDDCIKKNNICICQLQLSNITINEDNLNEDFKDLLNTVIINTMLKNIYNAIKVEQIDYDNKNKQSKLIELNEKYSKTSNVYIGNRETFWDEDDRELLIKYSSKMIHLSKNDGYNEIYLLDSNLIYFKLSNITIKSKDLSEDNFDSIGVKYENNEYLYNIANDVYVPFEQKELIEHIHRTKKNIMIYANIEYKLFEDIVGTGVEITFDD